jgi:hypothetical protein
MLFGQITGKLAAYSAAGALKNAKGATKSFNSAVNAVEALDFTIRRRKGKPQASPIDTSGSSPSLLRLTENSINWRAE